MNCKFLISIYTWNQELLKLVPKLWQFVQIKTKDQFKFIYRENTRVNNSQWYYEVNVQWNLDLKFLDLRFSHILCSLSAVLAKAPFK
jgi:hypothetical protein